MAGGQPEMHVSSDGGQDVSNSMTFAVNGAEGAAATHKTSIQALLVLAWALSLARFSDDGEVNVRWQCGQVNQDSHIHSQILRFDLATATLDLAGPLKAIAEIGTSTMSLDDASTHTVTVYDSKEPAWSLRMKMKLEAGKLQISPSWRSDMTAFNAQLHAKCTASIFEAITHTQHGISQSQVQSLTTYEREQIWRWNRDLPPNIPTCIHELITAQAARTPDAQAICAWDGNFTHGEVEELSTSLAKRLLAIGVCVGEVVPICFDKSRLTVIAVLAVMKTGAAILLVDPSQPQGRLADLAEQVKAKFIVTSKRHAGLGGKIAPAAQLVALDEESAPIRATEEHRELPQVPPSAILYFIFTSGSTGKPKGVIISHETYTSGALPRADAVGYNPTSRVLDFASYAFDVSIDSMLCTLVRGGCLCIPSDEDRVNNLSGAIRKFKITMANLTPSVARVLDTDIIPALGSLGLGGESVSANEVNLWGRDTRIVIGYGPSECTVGCTINSSAATGKSYTNLGPGVGGVMWIVDPNDHEKLMPIGAVGELLVEGPIVGQGYLNDPDKTAAAFIEEPSWLVAGSDGVSEGRRGRLYKTGDLVRYDPDGSGCVVFVGRKDTQVKLRGQRVELGEIEHQLRAHLPQGVHVAAEVLRPQGKTEQPTLVAFVSEESAKKADDMALSPAEPSTELFEAVTDLEAALSKVLPIYMIPMFYIPIDHMPILVSGKTDRKRLREFGASAKLQHLSMLSKAEMKMEAPSTEMERALLPLWAKTLSTDAENVSRKHNFFALGGDSIAAMKLVTVARDVGLSLTVADVFRNPVFKDMACVTSDASEAAVNNVAPFSLLSIEATSAIDEAAKMCRMDKGFIEDLYPCTPSQEMLITFSERTSGGFVAQRVADISHLSDINTFKAAWNSAALESPIFRTRIIQLPEAGLLQVVTKEQATWAVDDDLQAYLSKDRYSKMQLSDALARYAIIRDGATSRTYFVWTVHHALYDAWATPCIIERVERALRGLDTFRLAQMKHFVAYLHHADREASREYWTLQLKDATGPQFPALPSRTYLPRADAEVEHHVSVQKTEKCNFTLPIIIRAAWALVASLYAASDDMIFGETLNGRNIPLPCAEQLEGPMITTVPVRVHVDREATIGQYLQGIQDEAIRMMPHEHVGLQNIRKLSVDAQLACEIKTGLNIQPGQDEECVDGLDSNHEGFRFESSADTDPAKEALRFNSYPLLLVCSLGVAGFRILAGFDSSLISVAQMKRMLEQFDFVCQQLLGDQNQRLGEMLLTSDDELDQIWSWSRNPSKVAEKESDGPQNGHENTAIFAHDAIPWIVDPNNYQRLMPIGAVGEVLLEADISSATDLEDPGWLTAGHKSKSGHRGHLSRTGNLAKYDGDGSIVLVGRKDKQIRSQGRTVDLNVIERHLRTILPRSLEVMASIVCPASTISTFEKKVSDQSLVAFISEDIPEKTQTVELNTPENATFADLPPELLTYVSAQVAESMAGIRNRMSNVLPPHMIPEVFIPMRRASFSRETVERLSRSMSRACMQDYKGALKKLREDFTSNTQLTVEEHRLQQLWGETLKLEPSTIAIDDSFFGLGADSIMAMKLVSAARRAGYLLSVAKIFQNMRLREMASVLEQASSAIEEKTYTPFSALDVAKKDDFLDTRIRPVLQNPTWKIKDVLPVTDPQARDIMATITKPRSAVQYTLMYLNKSIDAENVMKCCEELIDRHDIMRTIFVPGQEDYLQVILDALPRLSTYIDADGDDISKFARRFCERDVDGDFQLGSPFARFYFINGKQQENCLVLRLSHAQYDGISLPELIRQLVAGYEGAEIQTSPSFSSYMYACREGHQKSVDYWQKLLSGSRLTPCPGGSTTTTSIFLDEVVDIRNCPKHITMSTLLTAAWAVVLSRSSGTRDVIFGGVTSGRDVDMRDVERVIGPCYQYMPIRVALDEATTASQLLVAVQDQIVSSAPFSTTGFRTISKACTEWPQDADFYGSIVHHQDFDDFDTMNFAGTSCRVDIANPHREASRPWKVVSFSKNGEMNLGIVGDETEQETIQARLTELVDTVHKMMERPEMKIVDKFVGGMLSRG